MRFALLLASLSPPASDAAWVTSTLAGSPGNYGKVNGAGTSATFYSPAGVAVAPSGTIYVADSQNYIIRAITPAGVVSTFAGDGYTSYFGYGRWLDSAPGSTGGSFYAPMGVCVDANNNVYVGDSLNYAIRSITPAGTISTFFPSNGGVAPAQYSPFTSPAGCAVDGLASNPTVYIGDSGTGTVWKTRYTAGPLTAVGQGGSAGGSVGVFGVALDAAGNVYFADVGYNVIRMVTQGATWSIVAGFPADSGSGKCGPAPGSTSYNWWDGVGTNACFKSPRGVAYSAAGSCLYVADTGNNAIRMVALPSGAVTTIGGAVGAASAGASAAAGTADGVGTGASFSAPYGLAMGASGLLYVADYGSHTIRVMVQASPSASPTVSPSGSPSPTAAATPLPGSVPSPYPSVQVTTLAGSGAAGASNGLGTAAAFSSPQGAAMDATTGVLLVADTFNNQIRAVQPNGAVSTFAGSGVYGTLDISGGSHADPSRNGSLAAVQLRRPTALFVLASSANGVEMYVLETSWNTNYRFGSVRYIGPALSCPYDDWGNCDPSTMVPFGYESYRVAGGDACPTFSCSVLEPYFLDGPASNSYFNQPQGLTMDAAGNIFVADTGSFWGGGARQPRA